jgi:hypothetical protein
VTAAIFLTEHEEIPCRNKKAAQGRLAAAGLFFALSPE